MARTFSGIYIATITVPSRAAVNTAKNTADTFAANVGATAIYRTDENVDGIGTILLRAEFHHAAASRAAAASAMGTLDTALAGSGLVYEVDYRYEEKG